MQKGLTHPGLSWRWVFYGALIMFAMFCAAVVLTIVAIAATPAYAETIDAWLPLAGFFVGGLLTGRLSPGRTLVEPALGAAFAIIGKMLFHVARGEIGVGEMLIGTSIAFVLALGGAWVGEKMQGTV